MGGGWPELRQGGRRRRRRKNKGRTIYAEGQRAPATARTLTRRPYAEPNSEIYFLSLLSLLSLLSSKKSTTLVFLDGQIDLRNSFLDGIIDLFLLKI